MFSSKQPVAGAKTRAGAPHLSFIGSEVIVSGDLASDARLQIDGRVDGNVRCASLSQGPEGIIAGVHSNYHFTYPGGEAGFRPLEASPPGPTLEAALAPYSISVLELTLGSGR